MQRTIKAKKNQNALYMIANMSSRRCGSCRMYLEGNRCGSCRMYLEGNSPYQAVMIVCELN